MRKLRIGGGVGFLAVCGLVWMASADTTAWWHFDEQDAGYAFTKGVSETITNEFGSTTSYAETLSFNGTATGTGKAAYYPRYEKPFRGLCVYDPVSGQKRTNRSCLRFTIGKDEDKSGDAGRAFYGGCLKIPSDLTGDATSPTGAFTVECFVCTTGGSFSVFAPIFGKRRVNSWTDEAWSILMLSNGKLATRFRTSVASYLSDYTNGGDGTHTVADGSWHHVAFVYDKAVGKATVYVDYETDFELAADAESEEIAYGTDAQYTHLFIGGYGYCAASTKGGGGRRFPGLIDEVRISNVALTPAQFLRLQPLDMDTDTVLRVSFDPNAYTSELKSGANLSDHTYGVRALYKTVSTGTAATFDATETAGATVGERLFADGVADGAALNLATNEAGVSAYVQASSLSAALGGTAVDFTIECFFKTRAALVKGTDVGNQTVFKFSSAPFAHVIFRADQGNPFCFAFKDDTSIWRRTDPQLKGADDGEWHHVAFVNDAANKQVRGYLDHTLMSVSNNVTILSGSGSLFIGRSHESKQYFDGWIDDLRVTKRALRPEEFLTTHPVGAAAAETDTLLFADFENSLALKGAADALAVDGTVVAWTDGAVPSFNDATPGALLLDGEDGTERVTNKKSLACAKGYVIWPESPLYEQEAFTVELFAKVTEVGQYGNLIRLNQGSSSVTANPVWSIYSPDADGSRIQVRVQMLVDGASASKYPLLYTLDRKFADGRWHHYALTAEPVGGTSTRLTLWCDYEQLEQNVVAGTLDWGALGGHRLLVGSSRNDRHTLGCFDGIRLTRGVLPVAKFMRALPDGLVLMVR